MRERDDGRRGASGLLWFVRGVVHRTRLVIGAVVAIRLTGTEGKEMGQITGKCVYGFTGSGTGLYQGLTEHT